MTSRVTPYSEQKSSSSAKAEGVVDIDIDTEDKTKSATALVTKSSISKNTKSNTGGAGTVRKKSRSLLKTAPIPIPNTNTSTNTNANTDGEVAKVADSEIADADKEAVVANAQNEIDPIKEVHQNQTNIDPAAPETPHGFYITNWSTLLTVVAIVIATVAGLILKETIPDGDMYWTERKTSYVVFIGELFMNLLQCMTIPLITTTVIAAIGAMDLKQGMFIAVRGFGLFTLSTLIAILLGLLLAFFLKPGRFGNSKNGSCIIYVRTDPGMLSGNFEIEPKITSRAILATGKCVEFNADRKCRQFSDDILNLIRAIFPPNMVQAAVLQIRTVPDFMKPNVPSLQTYASCELYSDSQNSSKREPIAEYGLKSLKVRGTNIYGLILTSAAMAIAGLNVGVTGLPFMHFFISFAAVTVQMTSWIVWVSPLGVCSLVLGLVVKSSDLGTFLLTLGFYFATVVVGLVIHSVVILPLIYILFTRKNPISLYRNCSSALINGFRTGSNIATVPLSVKCLQENSKIDPRVVQILIKHGCALNFNGHGLFEMISVIYVAQIHDLDLSASDYVALVVMALIASAATPGVTHGGLFTLIFLLHVVRLEVDVIAYVLPIEWLLDRVATVTNVLGDLVITSIVHHTSRTKVEQLAIAEAALASLKLKEEHESIVAASAISAETAEAETETEVPPSGNKPSEIVSENDVP